ncbi:hypothetical protein CBOM_05490 [Ceraceosorus bombacis]|uniref:Uncharacterized protein n=1 Tax=Ceraceosorus bombacis TaxID=401625 RepID=A0A0P1BQA9_9BASI|nr:hypothetical protein CBOM_05490 [Ceraceosorus bombacis]
MPRLPDPPTTLPTPPTTGSTSANSDIEIEVANASPTKMAALRRQLDDSEHLGASRRAASVAARSEASDDGGASAIGRLALHESSSDEVDSRSTSPTDAFVRSPPSAGKPALLGSDLPARAQVERTSSGRVDPTDPKAHEVQGPELLVPSDDAAKRYSSSSTASEAGVKVLGYDANAVAAYREGNATYSASPGRKVEGASPTTAKVAGDAPTSRDATNTVRSSERELHASKASAANAGPKRSATLGNFPTTESGPDSSNGNSVETAQRARDAINLGRSKSQKLRRPPPGVMLTAADLDASDDEYEPGWASVISSSRN